MLAVLFGLFGSSVFAGAVVFGFRHGIDWDHIAALTDLTGSQPTSRRSMLLATLYAVGHAVMVLALGTAAIVFAERLPDSVDAVLEPFVGATLIALGVYIVWSLVRDRGRAPLRSRWMLLLAALRRLVTRGRGRVEGGEPVVIEHAHPHDHEHPLHAHPHGHDHDHNHDHRDQVEQGVHGHDAHEPGVVETAVLHSHTHRHLSAMPSDPFMTYGGWSALAIGLLHGIGAETPTQVLVFAAAANAGGTGASVGVLLCFVVGLLAANTAVAAGSTYGFHRLADRRWPMVGLSAVTAAFSLVIGTMFLLGEGAALPALLGG
jgi:hypothetical protein